LLGREPELGAGLILAVADEDDAVAVSTQLFPLPL
jgi:hypothetical protein